MHVGEAAAWEGAPLVTHEAPGYRTVADCSPSASKHAFSTERKRIVTGVPGVDWVLLLANVFGEKFLVMLFMSQHMMKGFMATYIGAPTQFVLAAYGVAGPRMQVLQSVIMLPWAVKPAVGLLSDSLPVRGLHKAPYVILASALGFGALLQVALRAPNAPAAGHVHGSSPVLGAAHEATLATALIHHMLPPSMAEWFAGGALETSLTVPGLVLALFCVQMQLSTCDLLTEASYAEKMRSNADHGPELMSFVWGGIQVFSLFAIGSVGYLMDLGGNATPYLFALIPSALILVPTGLGYLGESKRTPEQIQRTRQRLWEQKELCLLCMLVLFGTISLSIVGTLSDNVRLNALVALVVMVVLLVAFSILLNPVIAKVNAFFLVQTSLAMSISGASFYFYTDGPEEYPEGPHFSLRFFTSVLGLLGTVCSLLGIVSYQRTMKNWRYRSLLIFTNLLLSFLACSDVIMFARLNIKWGIPDKAFCLGASVLQMVVSSWMWMPGVVILSQLCPRGMEATMYALLAGCHNLGGSVSGNLGALLLEILGAQPTGAKGESHQFDNLWVASAISSVLPMFTLLLLPFLIPDAKQTDVLLPEGQRHATSGSLLRSWLGLADAPEVEMVDEEEEDHA